MTYAECGFENPPEAERSEHCQNCGAELPATSTESLLAEVPGQESFINKARITPAQQVHLRLLNEMLAAEGKNLPAKALQEARARIEALEAEMAALKALVTP